MVHDNQIHELGVVTFRRPTPNLFTGLYVKAVELNIYILFLLCNTILFKIHFSLEFYNSQYICVYIQSCYHIYHQYLSSIFPKCTFYLSYKNYVENKIPLNTIPGLMTHC